MGPRQATLRDDLRKIDMRLMSAERPSGLLMTLLQGLDLNGKLPAPPRSLGLPGYEAEEREREQQRRHEREKERQKERKKRRSRSKSRSRSSKKSSDSSRSRSRRRR